MAAATAAETLGLSACRQPPRLLPPTACLLPRHQPNRSRLPVLSDEQVGVHRRPLRVGLDLDPVGRQRRQRDLHPDDLPAFEVGKPRRSRKRHEPHGPHDRRGWGPPSARGTLPDGTWPAGNDRRRALARRPSPRLLQRVPAQASERPRARRSYWSSSPALAHCARSPTRPSLPPPSQSAAAAPSHRLQPLWLRTGATSASRRDCRSANTSSSRAPERVRRSVGRRRRRQRPKPLAQLTLPNQEGGAGSTVLDVALDRGYACLDRRSRPAPARRSRPATSGTSCEVPHAPERPADVRDTG